MENSKKEWVSKNGYQMDEVVSSLQKSIRRGLEYEAGFWALELIDSGYWRYLMDRLQTIAAEDVGLANPQAIVVVNAVRQGIEVKVQEAEKRGKPWVNIPREQIGFLILYLCRSDKSRMADDFIWYLQKQRKEGKRIEIPAYTLDEHTKRGREKMKQVAKGKGITVTRAQEEEFYQNGGLLQGGDNSEQIGGRNWSRLLFEEMGIPYTGYRLTEKGGEE
jgi:replication-associated recombination protein RarA